MNLYGAYKNARNASWQVLIDFKISTVPVRVTDITNASGISLIKNTDVNELKDNEVGISLHDGDGWYIIYDDTVQKERIRFTIAHELGHIFLGHPLRIGYHTRVIDSDKPDVEREADIFASRLLMPACVIWGLNLHTADEIKQTFGVSYTAAQIRAERMKVLYERNKFLTSNLEKQVFENFKAFITTHRKEKNK